MEKKRSIGVTIASILMLFFSLWSFFIAFSLIRFSGIGVSGAKRYFDLAGFLYCILWGLTALVYGISGISILKLKDWARTIIIRYTASITIILVVYALLVMLCPTSDPCGKSWAYYYLLFYIFPIVLCNSIFFIFFTRHKVKEQFQ